MNRISLKLIACALAATSASHTKAAENQYNNQSMPAHLSSSLWSASEYEKSLADSKHWEGDSSSSTYSRSPRLFYKRSDLYRYSFHRGNGTNGVVVNDGVYYLAHRGLVHMALGINENTLDAVQHAIARGINMIELDIQASKNGRPMVTHDDYLTRTTKVSTMKVNYYDAETMLAWKTPTVMKNPNGTDAATTPRYCTNGNQLMTLDTIYQTMQGNGSYPRNSVSGAAALGSCASSEDITYFLDPKNLASGQSVFKFIADSNRSGSDHKKFYVKTYDNFWAASDSDAAALALEGISASNRKRIQVMPVISIRAYLDKASPDYNGAVTYAGNIIKSWAAEGVAVAAVEFPGAWDDKWTEFVTRFYKHIGANPAMYYGNNPTYTIKTGEGPSGGLYKKVPYYPVLSYGYRFPDYTKDEGGIRKFYNWSMSGEANLDSANKYRGTLGALYEFARDLCKTGFSLGRDMDKGYVMQSGCFVTTDFPHWELNANRDTPLRSSFQGSPERHMGF